MARETVLEMREAAVAAKEADAGVSAPAADPHPQLPNGHATGSSGQQHTPEGSSGQPLDLCGQRSAAAAAPKEAPAQARRGAQCRWTSAATRMRAPSSRRRTGHAESAALPGQAAEVLREFRSGRGVRVPHLLPRPQRRDQHRAGNKFSCSTSPAPYTLHLSARCHTEGLSASWKLCM